ncbi:MAG: DUF1294 domain-containing protein [Bacillota bacterium]
MSPSDLIIITAIIWNAICFFVMSLDKARAVAGKTNERVPEKTIFILALFFGSFGIYGGMYAFRHKTRKWYFQIGIPIIIALQGMLLFRALY